MCSSNLDYRRFRFTLATFCSSQYLKELFISCFLSIFPPVSPLESGCKDKDCFSFSKLFKLFFPAPRLTSFPRALSLESGCKDKAMIPPFPNFFTVFFHLFPFNARNHMNSKTLHRKVFFHGTCPDHGKNGRWPGNPARDGEKIDENSNRGKGTTGGKGRQKEHEDPTLPYQGHPRTPLIRLYLLYYTGIPRENTGNSTKRDKAEGCNSCCFQKLIYHGIAWMKTPSLYTEI